MLIIMFIGYFIIGAYIGADVRRVLYQTKTNNGSTGHENQN